MRILHVTESWGGGTATSLLAMAAATPQVEHHLLASRRADSDVGADTGSTFASATTMPANPVAAAVRLRALIAELRPDAVHAHSSIAGALVRAVRPPGTKVVYSAHCFAFDRRDISGAQRAVFTGAERALVRRTDLMVAVSPREVEAARSLGHTDVVYVPNRAVLTTTARASFAARPHIVTIGRVAAIKDWRYFIDLKRYAEAELGIDATWEWLGGGDAEGERAIRGAGIELSGWLDHAEILERAAAAQIYAHTAAWESAPMSVFEAAALGLPLVLRAIHQLEVLRLPGLGRSVQEMAARIQYLQSPSAWAHAQEDSDALTRRHSLEVQGQCLGDAYRKVCDLEAAHR